MSLLPRVACGLILLCPYPALAHARLTRSEPASGTSVESPHFIRLWFSERPETRLTAIALRDERGMSFSVLAPQSESQDPLKVSFAITAILPAGQYTVDWRTVSSDGHPSHGRFSFMVVGVQSMPGTQSPSVSRAPASSTPSLSPVSFDEMDESAMYGTSSSSVEHSVARALSFGGILFVIGVIVFNLLVVSRSDRIGSELVWQMESRAAVVGVSASTLIIIAAFTRLFLESRMMNAMPGMEPMGMTAVLMNTQWGFAMRLQIIAASLALIAFAVAIPRVRGAWLIASLAGAVLGVTPALAGHAAATLRLNSLMILTDFLHVIGAASWLGNLACVMFIGVPVLLRAGGTERWQSIAALVNTFSPIALASAVIVVLSGVIASWVHLERLSALWSTSYGQVLLLKLALVVVTLVIGAYNFRRVQPLLIQEEGTSRLRRSTALELTTGALIILVTGFLTGISP